MTPNTPTTSTPSSSGVGTRGRAVAVAAAALIATGPALAADGCAVVLKGAHVWTGMEFATRDLAWDGARLVAPRSGLVERPADWLWLTPPLTDAHTHTLDPADKPGNAFHAEQIKAGVFYALNPNSILPALPPAPSPTLVEVAASGGGVTRPGGHPRPLYEGLAARGLTGGIKAADLPGRAFHEAATPDQARAAVRAVKATGVGLVKLYLLHHGTPDSGGLDQASFLAAADEARKLDLNPVVHVENADDFRLAVRARVHGIVHLPGAYARPDKPASTYLITPADAAAAKAAGLVVVPTIYTALNAYSGANLANAQRVQTANLTLLRDAGVAMAVGADNYPVGALAEATLLRWTTLFGPADLIRMLGENGLRLAFPDRKLGRLEEGWEASFVGYYADPVTVGGLFGQPILGVRGGEALIDGAGLLPPACKP